MESDQRESDGSSNRLHGPEDGGTAALTVTSSSSSSSSSSPSFQLQQSKAPSRDDPRQVPGTTDHRHLELPLLPFMPQSHAGLKRSHGSTLSRPSLPPRSSSFAASSELSTRSTSQPLTSSIPMARRQADAFMASLLRAAQARDIESRQDTSRRRPMSVSSIVDTPDDDADAVRNRNKKQRIGSTRDDDQRNASPEKERPDMERGQNGVHLHPDRYTHLYHSSANNDRPPRPASSAPPQPSPLLLSMSTGSPPSFLQPLPRNNSVLPSYTATYSSPEIDRQKASLAPTPSYEWPQPSSSSFTSSSASNSSSSRLPSIASRSVYTNDALSSTREQQTQLLSRSSSSSGSSSLPAGPSVFPKRGPASTSSTQDQGRSSVLTSKITEEEQRWSSLSKSEKSIRVRDNILLARNDLVFGSSPSAHWPPNNSVVTSVRCMYANIAQKSYGSEKRFLCPPPVIKIDGPLRPCKWACARVISGDAPTPSALSMRSASSAGVAGEEEALIDSSKEARFGKLHVGTLPESRGKTFRLQMSLLRGEDSDDPARVSTRDEGQSQSSRVIPPAAWSTLHSAPISVISKPARKSARTRAASPAIASGSIVCLYNRLNSQTVRTKYLSVDVDAETQGPRKLIARQDGWEGFAIDLLARPVKAADTGQSSAVMDGGEITYGSILSFRDLNTGVCSEPMLICKVDKGKVDVSSITNEAVDAPMLFEMVGRDKMAVREVLMGARQSKKTPAAENVTTNASPAATAKVESPEAGSESPDSASVVGQGQGAEGNKSFYSAGGAVIQMQKVTLMQVLPHFDCDPLRSDRFECNLATPRSYLCSTAFEGAPDAHTSPALTRSREQLHDRFRASVDGTELPDDDSDAPESPDTKKSPTQTSSFPIGFVRPPTGTVKGQTRVIDVLEDPFCWTIVTISQTDVSYIEANPRPPTSHPHIPADLSPITPFPILAALPSYDHQTHAVAATIYDFHYNQQVTQSSTVNNACAIDSPAADNIGHEIWLGHSGPLNYRSTSAGSSMCDVTFQLPSLSQLQTLHAEFHSDESNDDPEARTSIRLPILFVRAGQGITFDSGHWLQATYYPEQASASLPLNHHRSGDPSPHSWRIALV